MGKVMRCLPHVLSVVILVLEKSLHRESFSITEWCSWRTERKCWSHFHRTRLLLSLLTIRWVPCLTHATSLWEGLKCTCMSYSTYRHHLKFLLSDVVDVRNCIGMSDEKFSLSFKITHACVKIFKSKIKSKIHNIDSKHAENFNPYVAEDNLIFFSTKCLMRPHNGYPQPKFFNMSVSKKTAQKWMITNSFQVVDTFVSSSTAEGLHTLIHTLANKVLSVKYK